MAVIDRINGLTGSVAMKAPCLVATTANITLSGLQTIDGVTVATGNRVLVKDQTDAAENGIYTANTSSWSRVKDFDGSRDAVQGTVVAVVSGTTNENTYWRVTNSGTIMPGTTEIEFELGLFSSASTAGLSQGGTVQDAIGYVTPEMFSGATGAAKLQAAIDNRYAAGGGEVRLYQDYDLSTVGVDLKENVSLIAWANDRSQSTTANKGAVVLTYTGSSAGIRMGDGSTFSCRGARVKGIELQGSGSGVDGILMHGAAGGNSGGNVLEDVVINNFTGSGLKMPARCFVNDFYRVQAKNCAIGFDLATEANDCNFYSCSADANGIGWRIGDGVGSTLQTSINLFGGKTENSTTGGILVQSPSYRVNIEAHYMENNTDYHIKGITPLFLGVHGCSLTNATTQIELTGAGWVDIQGNFFLGTATTDISISAHKWFGRIDVNKHGSTAATKVSNLTTSATENFYVNGESGGIIKDWVINRTTVLQGTGTNAAHKYKQYSDSYARLAIYADRLGFGDGTSEPTQIQLAPTTAGTRKALAINSSAHLKFNGGAWNLGSLWLGDYMLYVDASGRLRISNGEPASDGAGTIVGTQT